MSNTVVCEVAVGSCAIMFATISIDDPAVLWLNQNWVRISLVAVSCSFLAFVICLLVPASTVRLTFGRVLAAGTLGAIVAGGAGSIWESGAGPAATSAIIIFSGVGGWLVLVGIYQYLETKKNNGQIMDVFRFFGKKFFGWDFPVDTAKTNEQIGVEHGIGTDGKPTGNGVDGRDPDNRGDA